MLVPAAWVQDELSKADTGLGSSSAKECDSSPGPSGNSRPPATPASDSEGPSGWIDGFEIQKELGRGAFGVVYEALDRVLKRKVALKVANAATEGHPRKLSRFKAEAEAVAKLFHQHIVPVFGARVEGPPYWIASRLIKGRSLQNKLDKAQDGKVPRDWAVAVARKLAEALHYAHSQGLIHRDVKPANVMLDEKGEPMLVDFGLALQREGGEEFADGGGAGRQPIWPPRHFRAWRGRRAISIAWGWCSTRCSPGTGRRCG